MYNKYCFILIIVLFTNVDVDDDDYDVDDDVDDFHQFQTILWWSTLCAPLVPQMGHMGHICQIYPILGHILGHIYSQPMRMLEVCHVICIVQSQGLEIVWKQTLMKIVLNDRYIILVYVFHSYFWFMSLIEDTGG